MQIQTTTSPSELASVVDYDNALLHLGDAVADSIELLVDGELTENKLKLVRVRLGEALVSAMEFRTLAGAEGALPLEAVESLKSMPLD